MGGNLSTECAGECGCGADACALAAGGGVKWCWRFLVAERYGRGGVAEYGMEFILTAVAAAAKGGGRVWAWCWTWETSNEDEEEEKAVLGRCRRAVVDRKAKGPVGVAR